MQARQDLTRSAHLNLRQPGAWTLENDSRQTGELVTI
jgi:hypothetical protein